LLGDRWVGFGGSAPIVLGVILAIIFAGATYALEPYRRIVIGYLGGSLIALALLGLDRSTGGVFVAAVAVCGGVAGAMLAAKYFDHFMIATTAFGGAALSVLAAQHMLLGASAGVRSIEFLLTAALTAVGVGFQMRHLPSWIPAPEAMKAEPVRHEAEPKGRT
jgi:hypothetical protein